MSFTHRPVAAICYEVEPVDGPARITVQSELTANEQLPPAGADPRVAAAFEDPLRGEYHDATGTAVVLVHKTRRSGLRVGAAMDHLVDCPAPVRAESRFADGGLVTAATVLAPGQKLRVIKFGVEVPEDISPGIRWVPASKATPPRASASRSPRGQCGHIDVARMSSRSPRYSPAQPTRPGQ
ncbi:MAG TPA: hypothetical protein VF821_21965 [Lentzea sp.]